MESPKLLCEHCYDEVKKKKPCNSKIKHKRLLLLLLYLTGWKLGETISAASMDLPEDRISPLPDEILLIILSFLTFKEMLKTSILSSRWVNLWVNTPVLDFQGPISDDLRLYDDKERNNFVEWVNHVLQRHTGQYLKEFRIVFNLNKDHQKDIDRWLEFALAKNVEILELNFLDSGCNLLEDHLTYVLPDCFLKFSSGKANLDGSKSRFLQFELKCLKLLSLKHVDVTGEAINSFLLNCPFLERLEVVSSRKLVNLVISDPTLVLKYLHIKYCFGLKVLSIANFNMVSLDLSYGNIKDLTLRDLPMLVELSIVGYSTNLRHILSQNATCLPQLEALTLIAYELQEVTMLSSNFAHLTKLKRLVIQVGADGDTSLIALFSLVKSCHHLKEFVLMLLWLKPERTSRTMCEVERHSSKSKCLKVFEFKGYYGRVCDVEFVMHVVENAPSLEKIIIDTCNLRMREHNYPEHSSEKEARSFALKQFEDVKESKYIPPHVDVIIR